LIFISIAGSIAIKRFRKYATVIILGIILPGPFIFVRNRIIGTLFRDCGECPFSLKMTGHSQPK